jgi:phospholipid-binding lipoprotein MlaA
LRQRLLSALLGIGAICFASAASAATPGDPFEKTNRRFYASGQEFDRKFLLPIAKVFHALTPGPVGLAIHNFVTNLSEPIVVANDILQARFARAARDTARLVLNTTYGVGGIIDLAKRAGTPHEDNDFGITLGVWGVPPGPYLYLPLLGPSTVRDALGQSADFAMGPLTYIRFPERVTVDIASQVVAGLDARFRAEPELDAIMSQAADPYATLRSVYLQSRQAAVRGESTATPVLPPLDEADPPRPPPSAAAGIAASASADVPAQPDSSDADAALVTARPWDRTKVPGAYDGGA